MEVGVAGDECDERKSAPLAAAIGKREKCDEQRHDPELSEYAVECTFVEVIARVRQS